MQVLALAVETTTKKKPEDTASKVDKKFSSTTGKPTSEKSCRTWVPSERLTSQADEVNLTSR